MNETKLSQPPYTPVFVLDSFGYTHPLHLPLKNALISLLDSDAFLVETRTGFAMPV